MTTAEMQNLQNLSSPPSMKTNVHAASQRALASAGSTASSPVPASTPVWMIVLVLCIAAATLAASLAYMGTAERPPAAGYALDRDWSAASPLGVDPVASTQAPMKIPAPVCDVCGRVEAVVSVIRPPDERPGEGGRKSRANGRKPVFEVQVRMDDGQTRTVHVEKPLAIGTLVTLEHGVLRPVNA